MNEITHVTTHVTTPMEKKGGFLQTGEVLPSTVQDPKATYVHTAS